MKEITEFLKKIWKTSKIRLDDEKMNFLDKLLDAGDSYGKQAVEDTQAKLKAQLSKEDAAESSSENGI